MKKCVIFDTNFINANKKDLETIKNDIKDTVNIIIPSMVVREIQNQSIRRIKNDYDQIINLIEKNKGILDFKENFKLEQIINEKEKEISKWLNHYAPLNILPYNNVNVDEILSRLQYKKAPFLNEENSSDKGFKDAIIWLSILKCEQLNEYDEVIFVTNDNKGFIKRKQELLNEYKLNFKNNIIFCSDKNELYINLGLVVDEQINKKNSVKNEGKIVDFGDLKDKLNLYVTDLIYYDYIDDFGNITSMKRFVINDLMTELDVEHFLQSLDAFVKKYMFFNKVNICELLSECGIRSNGEDVDIDSLININKIYLILKDNEELFAPFITYIKKQFNSLYFNIDVELADEDLPF